MKSDWILCILVWKMVKKLVLASGAIDYILFVYECEYVTNKTQISGLL